MAHHVIRTVLYYTCKEKDADNFDTFKFFCRHYRGRKSHETDLDERKKSKNWFSSLTDTFLVSFSNGLRSPSPFRQHSKISFCTGGTCFGQVETVFVMGVSGVVWLT